MYNFFFVESPSQLLSACDAVEKLSLKNNILLLNYGDASRSENKRQLESILPNFEAVEVIETSIVGNDIQKFITCTNLLLKLQPYKGKVYGSFIGEFRNNYFNVLSRSLYPQREVLLDDGNVTVYIQNRFLSNGQCFFDVLNESNSLFRYAYKCYDFIFGLADNGIPDLFSDFDLEGYYIKGQVNLKEKAVPQEVVLVDESYFFGSKYSEAGLTSFNDEILCLKHVYSVLNAKSDKTYYIPHRDDSKEKIEKIEDIGFQIKPLRMPAETYFKSIDEFPKLIAAFNSTTLYTLSKDYNFEVVFSFDLSEFINDDMMKQEARIIYDYYRSYGIPVLNCPLDSSV